MADSILKFTQEFAQIKSSVAIEPSADQKLMMLVRFWNKLWSHRNLPGFQSFEAEYTALIEQLVSPTTLKDLLPEELLSLLDVTSKVNLSQPSELVAFHLASVYCWLGESAAAVSLMAQWYEPRVPPPQLPENLSGQTEFDILNAAIETIRDSRPAIAAKLATISTEWTTKLRELHHDRVNCLFVEMAGDRKAFRARIRVLEGIVEQFGVTSAADEVAFDNQIKMPDDPFVESIYEGLEAVHGLMSNTGSKFGNHRSYHAHYRVVGAAHHFTGDSISLAAALVAYTQLLRPNYSRQERYLPLELAVTGAVNSSGDITAVNSQTLALKVRRAFFSRIRILVLPEDNEAEAHAELERLRQKYPRRKLRLVSADALEDVVGDLNVVRAEKVCIGEFMARSAYRYSRAARIQVPLLLILIYVLIVLMYPKAWPWFDRNPAFVEITGNGLEVFNTDSTQLWSHSFGCTGLDRKASTSTVADIDCDGKNEVLVTPKSLENELCPDNARLFVFGSGGELNWRGEAAILGQYPGDTSFNFPYIPDTITVLPDSQGSIIVTRVVSSNPARMHFKFWTGVGDSLGWYIHSGFGGGVPPVFLAKAPDTVVSLCYNNRLGRCALCILDPHGAHGVSPPYTDDEYDLSSVERGSQLHYIVFPPTDVRKVVFNQYSNAVRLAVETGGVIRAEIKEVTANEAALWYYIDSDYRVDRVVPDDRYILFRDSLVSVGLLPAVPWEEHNRRLVEAVEYWTDSGWVTEGAQRRLEGR